MMFMDFPFWIGEFAAGSLMHRHEAAGGPYFREAVCVDSRRDEFTGSLRRRQTPGRGRRPVGPNRQQRDNALATRA